MNSIPERITWAGMGVPIVLFVLLFLAYDYSFPLFHTLAELFTVFIALLVATIVATMPSFSRNSLVTYLGSGFFWIGTLDLVHVLGARGVELLPLADQYSDIKVWLASSCLESILLITAPVFINKHVTAARAMLLFGAASLLLLFTVQLDLFPQVFVEGQGRTPFKIGGEYVVVSLLVLALFHWRTQKKNLDPLLVDRFSLAIIFSILAELSLSLYASLGSSAVFIGHILKLFSFWLLYHALVRTALPVFRDISEPRDAEQALRASEQRYRTLVESLPQAVFLKDTNSVVLSCNSNYARWLDRAAEQVIGHSASDFHPAHLAAKYEQDDRRIMASGVTESIEEIAVRKDGEYLINTVKAPVRDAEGKVVGLIGIFWDITEQKAAENALRESEARFAEAEQIGGMGSWEWYVDTDMLYWSRGLYQITGDDPEVYSPTFADAVARVPPDARASFDADIQQLLQGGVQHCYDHPLVAADGSLRFLHVRARPVRDASGAVLRVVGSVLDITDRKRNEDELQSYREDLELRVAERTAKLQAAIRELESFSYSVSHDLHAPLRAINGLSHVLAEDYRGSLSREAGDYLDKIIQATNRMGQLIDGLLMLAKVVRKEPELLLLDMGEIAREVARELRAGEPERKVRFVIPDGVQVLADQTLLRLLLQNLLGNAWKFTRRREDPVIEVGRMNRDGQEVFFVRDNGIGIDVQFSGQLFRPFHRLHTEEEYEGTGIGLATVQRITQHHGGSTWLEGELGKGTVVQFTLSGLTEPL